METSPKSPNVELGHVRDGYPALASWIARDPDNETFVFRKFDRLAARNILHLQSKLIALEREIDQLDEQARASDDFEERQSLRRWETLMMNASDSQRPERKRVEKLDELKGLLREYHETLLLQSQIANFSNPTSRVLTTIHDYTSGTSFEPPLPLLSGLAKDYLSTPDLIALHPSPSADPLSHLFRNHWAFQTRQTQDPLDRTTLYKSASVSRTVSVISMVSATVLLIAAVMSLYSVRGEKVKLGLVAMYTVLFAASVALLTNARRAEVFASTAAYAAVLVVFVSGDLGGSGKAEECLVQLEGGIFKTVACPG